MGDEEGLGSREIIGCLIMVGKRISGIGSEKDTGFYFFVVGRSGLFDLCEVDLSNFSYLGCFLSVIVFW